MATTSAPKGKDPGTRTDASADGTGVLRCLWSERFGLEECPTRDDCCLVDGPAWVQLDMFDPATLLVHEALLGPS